METPSSTDDTLPASRPAHDPIVDRGRAWFRAAWKMMLAVARCMAPLWMTISLMLVAMFGLEVLFPISPMTKTGLVSAESLSAFGGDNRHLVFDQGQWWRIITSGLLHLNLEHLLVNLLCLICIGWLSEKIIGPAWFGALFGLCSIAGSVMEVTTDPPGMLTLGASGGTTGLFAAGLVISFRLPAGIARYRLQTVTVVGLAPALIPSPSPQSYFVVAYKMHYGGAACGCILALALLLLWPKDRLRPPLTRVAGAVAASYFALAGAAVYPAYASYRNASFRREFFEPFPDNMAEILTRAPSSVAAKPHDPRARFAYALKLEKEGDYRTAAVELARALTEKDMLAYIQPAQYVNGLRAELGYVLIKEHRIAEAREAAALACNGEPVNRLRDPAIRLQLCP